MTKLDARDKKVIRKVTMRSMRGTAGFQYEKFMGLSFLNAMIPAIEEYYPDKEKRIEAMKRQWNMFNVTPQLQGFIAGITTSMEKEAAANENYDVSSINAIKVSLMGPLSGIGDSLFWGSLKTIATGIGVALALEKNILGPILFLLIFNVPAFICKFWLPKIGFTLGGSALKKASDSGIMSFITKHCNIVGLMTVGTMTCSMVTIALKYTFEMNGVKTNIQELFDTILPSMLPILLVMLCAFLLKKKNVKPAILLVGIIVVSIILSFFGVL